MLLDQLPRDSATVTALVGPAALWGATEHHLATLIDLTAAANWQRAGRRSAPRPRPIKRPGVDDPNKKRFGTQSMTVKQYERHRRRRREARRGRR